MTSKCTAANFSFVSFYAFFFERETEVTLWFTIPYHHRIIHTVFQIQLWKTTALQKFFSLFAGNYCARVFGTRGYF